MNLAVDILAAFGDSPDRGNPEAVAIVDEWPEESAMQAVAREGHAVDGGDGLAAAALRLPADAHDASEEPRPRDD